MRVLPAALADERPQVFCWLTQRCALAGFGSLNGVYHIGQLTPGVIAKCNGKSMYRKTAPSGKSGWVLFASGDSDWWYVAPACNHPFSKSAGVPSAELNAALMAADCGARPDGGTCVWREGNADASDWELRPTVRIVPAALKDKPMLLNGETLSVVGEGSAAASTPGDGGGGLGARLLLLRPAEGQGGLDGAWSVVGQSPAVAYSGEEARQLVVLDAPMEARAGDCLGVGYEQGGVAALHYVPSLQKPKWDTRVCEPPSLDGTVVAQLLEQRHCTTVSRSYLMQVGFLDATHPRPKSIPVPQPEPTPVPAQPQQKTAPQGPSGSPGSHPAGAPVCAPSSHKVWLADGTNFPRQMLDQDTQTMEAVMTGPMTFLLKTTFQLPKTMQAPVKVTALSFSFSAIGLIQTPWEEFCPHCLRDHPEVRREIHSPQLDLPMLKKKGLGLVWTTKLKVTVEGCPQPLNFESNGVRIEE